MQLFHSISINTANLEKIQWTQHDQSGAKKMDPKTTGWEDTLLNFVRHARQRSRRPNISLWLLQRLYCLFPIGSLGVLLLALPTVCATSYRPKHRVSACMGNTVTNCRTHLHNTIEPSVGRSGNYSFKHTKNENVAIYCLEFGARLIFKFLFLLLRREIYACTPR